MSDFLDIDLGELAREIEADWRRRASALPHPGVYTDGITVRVEGEEIIATLEGTRANIREQGVGPEGIGDSGPFDIRVNLLKSAKAKRAKAGHRYQSIPAGDGKFFAVSETGPPRIHPGVVGSNLARELVDGVADTINAYLERRL